MISMRIDRSAGLVSYTCSGDITVEDFETAFEQRLEEPNFRPGMKVLWDCRNASISTLSNEKIQRIIEHNAKFQAARGDGMSAIVVSRDLDYGICRVYQPYTDGLPWDTMVFRDLAGALDWLGCSA